jgi:hypothetical protein
VTSGTRIHAQDSADLANLRRRRTPGLIRIDTRRATGWCGIGMIAAILINGPLSNAAGRVPTYWSADAAHRFTVYLNNPHRVDAAIVFFGLSNLIFIFAIGFFAGLRGLSERVDRTGWLKGVITIGASLFLAGGLLSETLSTGVAVVLRSTPAYHLEINTVLLLQGLWATALAQGQVALGVVIAAYSAAALRANTLPRWVAHFGVFSGVLTLARLVVLTHTVLWIALLQPAFIWIALVAIAQLRQAHRP